MVSQYRVDEAFPCICDFKSQENSKTHDTRGKLMGKNPLKLNPSTRSHQGKLE